MAISPCRRARAGVPRSTKRPCVPTRRRSADTTKEASMNALSVALLALLVAWPALAAAQTIKVGAVVPLTGRYGGGGAQVRAGYEIGVEHVNAAGGVDVDGKKLPLELVLLDDESDATKTVSRLETLAAQGVVAYLGGVRPRPAPAGSGGPPDHP